MRIARCRQILVAAWFTAPLLLAQWVFVPDAADSRIYTFLITPAGTPAPITVSNGLGLQPWSTATDPRGRFLYTANMQSNDISAYNIGAGGALTPIGPPVMAGTGPTSIAVDPYGLFAYAANCGSNDVAMYSIGANGGLKPIGSPVPAANCPSAITVDPLGRFVYVAGASGKGTVSAFTIQPDGSLAPINGQPVVTGGGFTAIAIDPRGRFAYATSSASGNLNAYSIDSDGNLTFLGSTLVTGGPYPVAVDPTGRFLYTAALGIRETQLAYSFDIRPTGLPIQLGSPAAAGPMPAQITVDPTGHFAYMVDFGIFGRLSNVGSFSIGADGSLTSLGFMFVGNQAHSIAIDPCPSAAGPYTPPSIAGISANPSTVWPPDGKLAQTLIRYHVSPQCGSAPACTLSVTGGAGATVIDANHVQLPAERSIVYTVTATCKDNLGATASASVMVPVQRQ